MDLDTRLLRLEERMEQVEGGMDRVEAALARLAEAQVRTEEHLARQGAQIERLTEQVRELVSWQQRAEEHLARHDAQFQALIEAQQRTEEHLARQGAQIERLTEQVRELVSWQRGEAGRRDGERYERDIVRRAPLLFHGGRGGAPDQPEVQRRLTRLLQAIPTEDIVPAEADPTLTDLLWWKGDRLAVVESAIQINGEDVRRAAQRTATLRQCGAQALAVVIGESWATPDTRERARASGIAWKVGADLSEDFLAFRRVVSEDGEGQAL